MPINEGGYNTRPQAELLGLSPNQLAVLLDGDWRTVGAVRINQALPLEAANQAWAFRAALGFLRLVRDHGPAPVTAGGNLNRKFVATALEALEWPPGYLDEIRLMNKVIDEPDVGRLFELRQSLVSAGYLRRQAGFRITKQGRAALEHSTGNAGAIFSRLFLARIGLTGSFLEGDGPIFRSAVGPALFLLSRYAAAPVDTYDLSSQLLIPHLIPHQTPSQLGALAYQWVIHPCLEFDLLGWREDAKPSHRSSVWITPLFQEFIRFVFEVEWRQGGLRLIR